MPTTTKADFKLFKKESEKWIDIIGLKGFEFRFCHALFDGDDNSTFADVSWDTAGRCAYINLYKEWPDIYQKNDNEVRIAAFHEVAHVFIGKLGNLARARYIKEREIEEEEHAIIRTLEGILFPKY